ncbi:MAG: radical SAM protein [Candidatus Nezhaarchaeales archaeon]
MEVATTPVDNKNLIHIDGELIAVPLVGCIAFGVIDRGTNVLQVRPTTLCPLSCIFCSTDAGPRSRRRATEYVVELDCLLDTFREVVAMKGCSKIEAHIDTVGDATTYPKLVELVHQLSQVPEVSVVSMQSHGALLTEKLAERLDAAGLSRLNLSIDSMDPELARTLSGTPSFDVMKVLEVAEYITSSLKMDVLLAPVWVPGVNDGDLPRIIEFAKRIRAGKRWPPLGIQKMEVHKYGRRPKGVKPMSWFKFYNSLRELEAIYGLKLILNPRDFGIRKERKIPPVFKKFEKVKVEVIAPGWLKGEALGVARSRLVTIVGAEGVEIGSKVNVRMLETKDNLYIARLEL